MLHYVQHDKKIVKNTFDTPPLNFTHTKTLQKYYYTMADKINKDVIINFKINGIEDIENYQKLVENFPKEQRVDLF